jgi:hypothetical protein
VSTILYLAALLVAILTLTVLMLLHIIDRLVRMLRMQAEILSRQKREDDGEAWKNEVD